MPLKLLVTVKRVEDPESKIRPKPDGTGIVTDGVSYKMNPFDEIAVEEALRLSEAHGGEVVVASHRRRRSPRPSSAPRSPWAPTAASSSGTRARSTRGSSRRSSSGSSPQERPDLVLLGKQAIDDDQNQTGQMLAARLAWPQATFASKKESLESEAEQRRQPGLAVSRRTGRGSRSCARWTAESRRSMSRCPRSSRSICGSTSRGSRRCPAS